MLRKLIPPEAELWCDPQVTVMRGPAAQKILELAASKGANLIVLGVHRAKGFAGAATHLPISTVHEIVTQAKCPVLTAQG